MSSDQTSIHCQLREKPQHKKKTGGHLISSSSPSQYAPDQNGLDWDPWFYFLNPGLKIYINEVIVFPFRGEAVTEVNGKELAK